LDHGGIRCAAELADEEAGWEE